MQEYVKRLVDEHAGGNKSGFADSVGIARPDVINAYNAAMGRAMKGNKGNVSVEMLQRIADKKGWTIARVLHDLEGIARDLPDDDCDEDPAPSGPGRSSSANGASAE